MANQPAESANEWNVPSIETGQELYRVGYDSAHDMATLTLISDAMSMTLRMNKNEVNRLKRMLDSVFDEECDHGESC